MCGICGMVGISDRELLEDMCDSLVHRGPDDQGMYIDRDIAMGVRRLSIIDLAGGHQPISNEDNSLWIVFNGEIYNFEEIRAGLEKRGHRFKTKSDTEVIVHSYEEYGDDCVQHFNGMFAFAIWDQKRKELFIARDRVGIKPFFYWKNVNYLLFGSEIKTILQDRRFERRINFTALYNYLSRLFVAGSDTIFKGIKRLEPGHILKYKNGEIRTERYWEIDFSRKIRKSEPFYRDRIYELLKESVRRRLIADVPLGVFLSGGVDSSGIVALMSELCDHPVKTFSLGSVDEERDVFNELPFARMVADRFRTEHHEFIIKASDLIDELPQALWHFDEPYGGSFPHYFLSRLAREHVKVALGGLGGDELFGSYGRSVRIGNELGGKTLSYLKLSRSLRDNIIERFVALCPSARLTDGFWRRLKDFTRRPSTIGKKYANLSECPYTDEVKKELCREMILEEVDDKSTLASLYQSLFEQANGSEFMDKMFYLDLKTQLVDEYLCYTDRLSMAHSLEMRVPYLDHEFIEFVVTIPSKLRSRPDSEKYLLKKTLSRLLPAEVIYRRKGGFSLPYGTWLRRELKDVVNDFLSVERIRTRGYFNPELVRSMVQSHLEGKRIYTYQIWNLLIFELWHQIYVDSHCYKKSDVSSLHIG